MTRPIIPLTEHETAILTLVSHGHTNDEIARQLRFAADTIKQHTARINRKLDARNRVHAVRRGFEHGILIPGDQP